MVEFNANGLYAFFQLMKTFSVATVKFGKEWVWWLIEQIIDKAKRLKAFLVQKFKDYFLKKDLT